MRFDNHDIEVEDKLRSGLAERVEQPQHADIALLLVEPLVVHGVGRLHRFEPEAEHHQISEIKSS